MSFRPSTNEREGSFTIREALENGLPDTAVSHFDEDTPTRNSFGFEGGSHPITAPTLANNGQPSIPQSARRPLFIVLACLLVYVLPPLIYHWIPKHIHPWICDKTL